jgi:hypothetical protein
MGMLHASRRAGFAEEPVAPRRISRARLLIIEHLDGDVSLQVAVDGAMYARDTACTHDLAQLVPIGKEASHGAGQRAAWADRRPLGVGAGRSPRLACAADRMIVSATA